MARIVAHICIYRYKIDIFAPFGVYIIIIVKKVKCIKKYERWSGLCEINVIFAV